MDTSVKGLNKWANRHTSYPIDILRVVLGVFFVIKGASFITHNRDFEDLITPASNFLGGMLTFHYIAAAHIVGGIIIVFGLLTRWAIIAQLPILIGAILINFLGEMNVANFILASITFVISMFFLFYGSGKHSADYYFKMEK